MNNAILLENAQIWAQMTDENRHSEVLKVIAQFFSKHTEKNEDAYWRFARIFEGIEMAHYADRGLSEELYQYRYRKMQELLNAIQEIEGKDIRDIVYNCL